MSEESREIVEASVHIDHIRDQLASLSCDTYMTSKYIRNALDALDLAAENLDAEIATTMGSREEAVNKHTQLEW